MKVVTAREAAQFVKSGDGVMVSGSGGGHCIPESILVELEQRYLTEALPRDLCVIHVVGLGDRATKGVAHFCHDGMIKRSITSALIDSPHDDSDGAPGQDRVLHPAPGRALADHPRHRRRPPRAHHQGRPAHLHGSAATGRPAKSKREGRSDRADDDRWRGMAALQAVPDRRRRCCAARPPTKTATSPWSRRPCSARCCRQPRPAGARAAS